MGASKNGKRALQHVSTMATRKAVVSWMIEDEAVHGEKCLVTLWIIVLVLFVVCNVLFEAGHVYSCIERCSVTGAEEEVQNKLLARVDAHKRIIWACTWSPCSRYFATGSRDRAVKVWEVFEASEPGSFQVRLITALPLFKCSVTALAWAPLTKLNILAIGKEDGSLEFWKEKEKENPGSHQFSFYTKVDTFLCHAATIHRLCWKGLPTTTERDCHSLALETLQLASAGADHTVRIYNFHIT